MRDHFRRADRRAVQNTPDVHAIAHPEIRKPYGRVAPPDGGVNRHLLINREVPPFDKLVPTVENVAVQCRTAGWGCIDCKKVLHESIEKELTPIRARAKEIGANPKKMQADLARGAEHARVEAQKTMKEVKQKMGLT